MACVRKAFRTTVCLALQSMLDTSAQRHSEIAFSYTLATSEIKEKKTLGKTSNGGRLYIQDCEVVYFLLLDLDYKSL